MEYTFTEKQKALHSLIKSPSKYILAYGGSRSGTTFGQAGILYMRAWLTPGSRSLIIRKTRAAAKRVMFDYSLPDLAKVITPDQFDYLEWSPSNMTLTIPNGNRKDRIPNAVIMVMGADDPALEAIMGLDFTTILIDDASEFDTPEVMWALSRRLSQKLRNTFNDKYTRPKMLLTCNPTNKKHWLYRVFLEGLDPATGKTLRNPEQFASIHMTAVDNPNLPAGYLEQIRADLSPRQVKRFVEGEWSTWEEEPNQTVELKVDTSAALARLKAVKTYDDSGPEPLYDGIPKSEFMIILKSLIKIEKAS